MKTRLNKQISFLCILSIFMFVPQISAQVENSDVLVVSGMHNTSYSDLNKDNEYVGLIPDFVQLLSKEIGFEYSVLSGESTLLASENKDFLKQCDLFMYGLSCGNMIDSMYYSIPYIKTDLYVIHRNTMDYSGFDELETLRVVVFDGTPAEKCFTTYSLNSTQTIQVHRVSKIQEACKLVFTAQCDYFVLLEPTTNLYQSVIDDYDLIATKSPDILPLEISVISPNPKLIEAVNTAILKFTNDGTLNKLHKRWMRRTVSFDRIIIYALLVFIFLFSLIVLIVNRIKAYKQQKYKDEDFLLKNKLLKIVQHYVNTYGTHIYLYDRQTKQIKKIQDGKLQACDDEYFIIEEFVHPDDISEYKKLINNVVLDINTVTIRAKFKFSGEYRYYECSVLPMTDDDSSVIVTRKDVTSFMLKQKDKEELINSFRMGAKLTKSTRWRLDLNSDEVLIYDDSAVSEAVSKDRAMVIDSIHPSDRQNFLAYINDLEVHGGIKNIVVRGKYSQGVEYDYFHFVSTTQTNQDNEVEAIYGVIRNVTDRHIDKMQLEELGLKLQLAFDSAYIVGWIYNRAHDKFSVFHGKPDISPELNLSQFMDLVHEEDKHIYLGALNEIFEKICDRKVVVHRIMVDGDYHYHKLSMMAQYDEDGNVSNVVGTRRDITADRIKAAESKLQHERLLSLNEYLNLVLRAADVSIWKLDVDGRIEKLFGESLLIEAPDLADYLSHYLDAENRLKLEALGERVIKNKETSSETIKIIDKLTGTTYYRRFVAHPTFAIDSQADSVICIVQDITSDVLKNNELTESNYRSDLLINASGIIPWGFNVEDGTYTFFGKNTPLTSISMSNLSEYKRHFTVSSLHAFDLVLERMMQGEDMTLTQEVEYVNPDNGDVVSLVFFVSPYLKDESGKVTRYIGYSKDVSDVVEQQKILLDALEQAKTSGRAKTEFLANMSHEIRTPLNAIVGFSELMSEIDDPEERQNYSRIINSNSELLLTLVNDVLDISRIEHGIEIVPVRQNFSQSFNDLCVSLKGRMTNPDVEFIIENPYENIVADVDFPRIAQVITNYATNAMKHTDKGSIRVGYSYDEQNEIMEVYVKDTGRGISEDKKHLVFERFSKLDKFTQGVGLGLSIVKALTKRFNVTCGFESTEGVGSYFWARGPLKMTIEE